MAETPPTFRRRAVRRRKKKPARCNPKRKPSASICRPSRPPRPPSSCRRCRPAGRPGRPVRRQRRPRPSRADCRAGAAAARPPPRPSAQQRPAPPAQRPAAAPTVGGLDKGSGDFRRDCRVGGLGHHGLSGLVASHRQLTERGFNVVIRFDLWLLPRLSRSPRKIFRNKSCNRPRPCWWISGPNGAARAK